MSSDLRGLLWGMFEMVKELMPATADNTKRQQEWAAKFHEAFAQYNAPPSDDSPGEDHGDESAVDDEDADAADDHSDDEPDEHPIAHAARRVTAKPKRKR
jgi:hypothetical protein